MKRASHDHYVSTADELRGIDRGLRDAAEGKFVSKKEVEAIFAKYRRGVNRV